MGNRTYSCIPPNIRRDRLSLLLGEPIPDTAEQLLQRLLEWMYTEPESGDSQMMKRFLARLESCHPVLEVPTELMKSIRVFPSHGKNTEVFHRIAGLRKAVKRFLTTATIQPKPNTLFLYSDHPIGWLTDDHEFADSWAMLMILALQQKNHICIIHNIDRSCTEMFEALEKWIPLYMTGLIQSFYCEKKQESRFYQTMFIIPQVCSVNAAFVAGTEDAAEYLLTTHESQIEYHYRQFQALLQNSKPLLRAFTLNSLNDYTECIKEIPACQGASSWLLSTLSVATILRICLSEFTSAQNSQQRKKVLQENTEQAAWHNLIFAYIAVASPSYSQCQAMRIYSQSW